MGERWIHAGGWYGSAAVVVAYGLAGLGVVASTGWLYLALNLTGAIGLLVLSASKGVRQSVVLNAVWIGVAVIGLVRWAGGV